VGWDPKTGKGDLRQVLSSGDVLRACFHCGYPGYTGGLVIGSFNGSGYGFYPRQPVRGFRSINVFCAQDESIWDLDEQVEYTYGWSENYGKGDDGKRLEYVRGRILEGGPKTVVLQSENAGGCYLVTKVVHTRLDVRHVIIATRIANRCDHPVHFDFFSGDDPWIGLYASSDGDVGWTPEEIVRREKAFAAGQFTAGGLYDLGNAALGQKEGTFSNQANFFALDPTVPLPDLAVFANAFAHSRRDIDPLRPLDNKTMTALNLGWTGRTLAPGQGLTVALALGLAETGEPGSIPRAPPMTEADWSAWRRYLKEGSVVSEAAEFAAELVELRVSRRELRVTGTYYLRNPSDASQSVLIRYPIITSIDRPPPSTVTVDGRRLPVEVVAPGRAESRFPVAVPPRGIARFQIQYAQVHTGRKAVYLTTSARAWPSPITRAVFIVRYPESLGRVTLSYGPGHREQRGKEIWHWIARQPFVPERELEVRW
jgi:hypothetical protein